jgi:hypothetical protein
MGPTGGSLFRGVPISKRIDSAVSMAPECTPAAISLKLISEAERPSANLTVDSERNLKDNAGRWRHDAASAIFRGSIKAAIASLNNAGKHYCPVGKGIP